MTAIFVWAFIIIAFLMAYTKIALYTLVLQYSVLSIIPFHNCEELGSLTFNNFIY